jgi:outer membrane protein OmpA-like peptidoglycan-associated protein
VEAKPVTLPYRAALLASCLLVCLSGRCDPPEGGGAPGIVSHSEIEQALGRPPPSRGIRLRGTPQEKRAIDLNIPFELDSSELKPEALAQLGQLAAALKSGSLAADRFLVAGHTDARGGAEYNRRLSLRRAQSVQKFLEGNGIEPARLDIVGRGKDELLTPQSPEDPANRRVEIRNLGSQP